MLIQFTVGNFRSIRKPVTLSMVATTLKAADPAVDKANTLDAPGTRLLGSAVIYGANASGKSNLIRAMAVMKRLVVDSARAGQVGDRLPMEPFLLAEETRNEPSFFEIVFRADDAEGGQRQYRYGFEATAAGVVSEWLYQKKQRESLVFELNAGEKPYFSDWLSDAKNLLPLVRPNSLFLSVAAQFNQSVGTRLLRWFERLTIVGDEGDGQSLEFTLALMSSENVRRRLAQLLSSLDTAVTDLRLEAGAPMPSAEGRWKLRVDESGVLAIDVMPRVKAVHSVLNKAGEAVGTVDFDLEKQESRGTNRMFALTGPILSALDVGKVLVIDEMESQLHPRITREILEMFGVNRPEGSLAQLIAATHDTNLLDDRLLRRDQVWFVEKDRFGASDLFSLAEIKVRNDANYETRYLGGAFGAVPTVGVIDLIKSLRGAVE